MAKTKSEVLTIMFVDLTNYTQISSILGREDFEKMHDEFDSMCKPLCKECSGKIIKKMGDAFLVTFKSASDAMRCSIELQKKFKDYNKKTKPKIPLKIKIALHTGEVMIKEKDIYGDVVNLVSRLAGKTPTTNIYFTKAVYFAMNKNEFPFSFVGLMEFKGVKDPVHVSKIEWTKPLRKINFLKILYRLFGIVVLGSILYFILR